MNAPTTPARTVLISGGSIAGTALAYWLHRHGFAVSLVELTSSLRAGGQAIDVRGPAIDVADRMGVLDALRDKRVVSKGMSMVDAEGNEVYRSTERTLTGGDIEGPDIEILREDLASIMADAAGDAIEYLFGDSITGITENADDLTVTFANREPRRFDLVIGADGLHSNTRRLVFGDEKQFLRHMGTYLAVWTAPNFLDLDHWQIFQQAPGSSWGGGIMSVRDNTEARVYMGFEEDEPLAYDYRDQDAQKRILADRLGGAGWVIPQALRYMWAAEDFHFDAMAQVKLDAWSKGRVALVGDAGYCGSPLSGQGTSMAMVGAYVLAGELKAANGDHTAAFAAYERELREYIGRNQRLAYQNKARIEAEQRGESATIEDAFEDVVNSYRLKAY